jgi:type I restriction enzyme S subunit
MPTEELVGALPVGWKYTTLGEACARAGGYVHTGPFGSQLHAADYVSDGIPSIMPQNIGDNRVIRDGIAQVTVEDAERLNRYRVRTGDIVYSRRGDVERRALIRDAEDGWLCGTGCLCVRFGDQHVNPTFASYYLGDPHVREWIVRHAHGATMPNLNTAILSALPFVLAPLPEQHAIAHILGTLDDKIELNQRMNETLEAIARALFKSWFVDFDPVRAKAEGRDPGLPKPLADLFPARLVNSEVGEIPEGWKERPLDDIADFLNGLALQKYSATDPADSLPIIKIAELRKGISSKTDRASCQVPQKYVIQDGDFLFSWSGSLLAKFWTAGEGVLNQHLFKVTSDRYPLWFVSQWVHQYLEEFQAVAASKATTMGHIQRGHLQAAMAVCPLDDFLDHIGAIMSPLVERAVHNELQSRTLTALRDTLLPKLISGELRVRYAERLSEDTT